MSPVLRRFRLTITLHGPVFIGSGEERTSKEYVVTKQIVYFPDMEKLFADVVARGKQDSFESFMLDRGGRAGRHGAPAGNARLLEWMEQNDLPLGIHGGYGIRLGDRVAPKPRPGGRRGTPEPQAPPINDIHMFIKDPFGRPYVPGSSVKGLLRTLCLEHQRLKQGPGAYHARLIQGDRREAEKVEAQLLRTLRRQGTRPYDAVNDLFQAIRVSDSLPLATAELRLCQKIDGSVEGDVSGLPLFRESLSPGTSVAVDLTVDASLWPDGVDFVQHISDVARSINERRYVPYVQKYNAIKGLPAAEEGPFVYLGGGAGFRSKTIVEDQTRMSQILGRKFNDVPHERETRRLGVSPLALKLTKIDDKLFEMGKCRLAVEELA